MGGRVCDEACINRWVGYQPHFLVQSLTRQIRRKMRDIDITDRDTGRQRLILRRMDLDGAQGRCLSSKRGGGTTGEQ